MSNKADKSTNTSIIESKSTSSQTSPQVNQRHLSSRLTFNLNDHDSTHINMPVFSSTLIGATSGKRSRKMSTPNKTDSIEVPKESSKNYPRPNINDTAMSQLIVDDNDAHSQVHRESTSKSRRDKLIRFNVTTSSDEEENQTHAQNSHPSPATQPMSLDAETNDHPSIISEDLDESHDHVSPKRRLFEKSPSVSPGSSPKNSPLRKTSQKSSIQVISRKGHGRQDHQNHELHQFIMPNDDNNMMIIDHDHTQYGHDEIVDDTHTNISEGQNNIQNNQTNPIRRVKSKKNRNKKSRNTNLRLEDLLNLIDNEMHELINPPANIRRSERIREKRLQHLQEERTDILDKIFERDRIAAQNQGHTSRKTFILNTKYVTLRANNSGYSRNRLLRFKQMSDHSESNDSNMSQTEA